MNPGETKAGRFMWMLNVNTHLLQLHKLDCLGNYILVSLVKL